MLPNHFWGAKTSLFELLTGIEKTNKLPVNKEYLIYDIVYKPKFVHPKFEGILESMGIKIDKLTAEQKKYLQSWDIGT